MKSELEKMNDGEWYDANFDKELIEKRIKAQDLCFELNQLKPSLLKDREVILKKLFGKSFENLILLSPFTCDYGKNISFGKNCFVNINCYFMDGAKISIGDNVFVGPNTGFYTATHPLDFKNRNIGLEKALPINIGNNVWIGANVSVIQGINIGDGCVIAAGTLVNKNIPKNSLVAGVPCKIIKTIEQ